jgi:hypothetical protein
MRTCKKCKLSLPLDKFPKSRTYTKQDGIQVIHRAYTCRFCQEKRRRERLFSTEEGKQKHREWSYKAGWKRLGIDLTWEEAYAQLESQNFACAICKDDLSNQKWNYDHNHTTLELRKILCSTCNTGIGMFDEDTHLLALAIAYLESFKE